MISKEEYEKAQRIVTSYENEQKDKGFAIITTENNYVERIPFLNPEKDLDKYLSSLLKGEKGNYKKLQELKNWKIIVDGESFTLPFYSKDLYHKWF